jgi:site-specific DNA-cytosine methylase
MSRLLSLRAGAEHLSRITGGTFTIGTGCSGTDLFFAVLERAIAHWAVSFGFALKVEHVFACENVAMKQCFIQAHFRPQHIFPDIKALANRVVCDMDGKDVIMRLIHCFACGIECDSISGLNSNRSENFDCIGDPDAVHTRTGGTGQAAISYIEQARPPVFMFENVKNLSTAGKSGKSNATILIEAVNQLGYIVLCMFLNVVEFGYPQNRERAYLVGVLISDSPINQTNTVFWLAPIWTSDVQAATIDMRTAPIPLQHFLLPDDHPDVVEANTTILPSLGENKRQPTRPFRRLAVFHVWSSFAMHFLVLTPHVNILVCNVS